MNKHYGKKTLSLTLLAGMLSVLPAYAATTPNSGTVLQSTTLPAIQQPVGQAPVITVEGQQPAAQNGGGEEIPVKGFRLSGDLPVPAKDLLNLIQHDAGKNLTLSELNGLADKLTHYLRSKGYLVAVAYIPAQDVEGGIVEIAVVTGKYGQIGVTGTAHFDPDRLRAMLMDAQPGDIITKQPLERDLILMNDIPGISVKGTLTPGTASGTADLMLDASNIPEFTGAVYSDNWGDSYTGKTRGGAQCTFNNFSERGDALNIGGLTTGAGINDYNIGYSLLLGTSGSKFTFSHSHATYQLGGTFTNLDASGQAAITSYGLNTPLIRNGAFSLYAAMGYDTKHLDDEISSQSSYNPRTSSLMNLSLSGNSSDSWLGGGNSTFSLTQYWGNLSIGDATELAQDTATTQTDGAFSKTVFTFQRQQYLQTNLDFNLDFTGQLASKNLDSSEKLYLGGPDGVRAFPVGEAAGDEGYLARGEVSWRMPGLCTPTTNLYLNSFYDYGSVMINKDPWAGAGSNRTSLMGAGLGLLWTSDRNYAIRLDYAWKIGDQVATADTDKNGRLWLQGVRYF